MKSLETTNTVDYQKYLTCPLTSHFPCIFTYHILYWTENNNKQYCDCFVTVYIRVI